MKWKAAAVASLLCGASLAQAPSNDLCANATPVFAGFNPGAPNGAPGTTLPTVQFGVDFDALAPTGDTTPAT